MYLKLLVLGGAINSGSIYKTDEKSTELSLSGISISYIFSIINNEAVTSTRTYRQFSMSNFIFANRTKSPKVP